MPHAGWISIGVVGYVLGQWWLLRPSAAEQQKMRLRERAVNQGFQVHLRKVPQWLQPQTSTLIVSYHWQMEVFPLGGIRWRRHADSADDLGEGVFAWRDAADVERWNLWSQRLLGVETTATSVVFYWKEEAALQDLDGLLQLAESFSRIYPETPRTALPVSAVAPGLSQMDNT